MASDLGVSLLGCGAVLQIQPFEDGVLAKTPLDSQHSFLHLPLSGQSGGFFLLLGILLYAVMPRKMNYEKYEKRCEKYGVQNVYAISAELSLLREQVRELEEKLAELEHR